MMDQDTQARLARMARWKEQQDTIALRQAEAAAWNADQDTDKQRGVGFHDPQNALVNFDQRIYWNPPHFNELRKELYEQWQDTIWPKVSWYMMYKPEEFIAVMNDECGLRVPFDSAKVDWMCEQFLKALRKKRGAA